MPVTTVDWIRAIVQVALLAVFFYNFYIALAQNKATQIIRSMLAYGFLYLVCKVAGLKVMESALRICAIPGFVFLCGVYQPDLRRTFTSGSSRRTRLFRLGGAQTSSEQIEIILSACQRLVQSKRGALIVFPRKLALKNIIDSGTKLNADISSAIIVTIFEHDTALHDGAMVIQGSKIIAAGCYLPLSGQTDIRASFGTRHRAALGMAEESDAAIIVVSEETGAISLACNGNLYYDLSHDEIKSMLLSLFNNLDVAPVQMEDGKNDAQ